MKAFKSKMQVQTWYSGTEDNLRQKCQI